MIVAVGASIAAYKACDVVSALRKQGVGVTVLMTPRAAQFVAPLALKTLSGRPVGIDLFNEPAEWGVGHVNLAKSAGAFVVVGATADLIARLAAGMADDFVTTAALVAKCPLLLAPAMNTAMWEHPATRANLATLKKRGWRLVEPADGLLACGDVGPGKLADVSAIVEAALAALKPSRAALAFPRLSPLAGRKVLVSAGPTRERLDPVRFLSNPSSGKMGYAIAAACRDLGAEVTLLSGPVSLHQPEGMRIVKVESALEMLAAAKRLFRSCDAFVSTAAVSDFRPAKPARNKRKKDGTPEALTLVPNPDILLELSQSKGSRILVGFAAETRDLLKQAAKKLEHKKLNLLVANLVGRPGTGFEADENQATLLRPGRKPESLPRLPKSELAARIATELASLLA